MEPKSITYVIFLYREQMRLGETPTMRLNRTKLSLTDKLIKKTAPNLDKCNKEDVLAFNQEILFKQKLKQEIIQHRRMQKTQPTKNVRKIPGLAANIPKRRKVQKSSPLALGS